MQENKAHSLPVELQRKTLPHKNSLLQGYFQWHLINSRVETKGPKQTYLSYFSPLVILKFKVRLIKEKPGSLSKPVVFKENE